jgi:hypothetical protein
MSGAVSYTLDQVMEELKKMPAHPSPARLLCDAGAPNERPQQLLCQLKKSSTDANLAARLVV